MPPRAFARHSGRRSVTKSRLGGGEEERPQRPLPTLSTSPHPAREEEQFVYLGLQESFPPPSSPRPPSPSSSPPSSARSCPVPPAAPSHLPLLFLLPHPSSPPSPSLSVRGRGGGSGRRFVRLAAGLCPRGRPAGRGAAPRGPAPSARAARAPRAPHSRPQILPRARRRGGLCFEEERLSPKSGREVLVLQTGSRKPLTHCSFSDCTRRRGRTCISTVSRLPFSYLYLCQSAWSPSPRPPRALPQMGRLTLELRLK